MPRATRSARPGVHVDELGAADVADQTVAPLAPVPRGPPVVDHADREPHVDVGQDLGIPRVGVLARRPPVHEHHHRERPVAFGRDVEPVHPIALAVVEVPRVERPAGRRTITVGSHHVGAGRVERDGRVLSAREPEPHVAVGSHARRADRAAIVLDRGQRARRELVSVEAVTALVVVRDEERGGIGPPVHCFHRTGEAEIEVGPHAAREVPDRGTLLSLALMGDDEPSVARQRGPARREQRHALVDLFGDRRTGPRIDDSKRRVQAVAVLGVLEREHRSVGREPAQLPTPEIRAPDADVLGAAPDLLRRLAVGRDVHREAVGVADGGGHEPRHLCETLVPAGRHPGEERHRVATGERLGVPPAGLAAGLVLPEEHTLTVVGELTRESPRPDGR